jgi:hypothetical protein
MKFLTLVFLSLVFAVRCMYKGEFQTKLTSDEIGSAQGS